MTESIVSLPSVIPVISVLCVLLSSVYSVEVTTQYGPIRGRTVSINNSVQVVSVDEFRAVPFAKPPLGSLRFASPVVPDPWTQVLEVTEPGAACPQSLSSLNETNPDFGRVSEDCLHMDIYSPDATSPAGTYAVMVWIYGGSYQSGANVKFPGHILASQGVVLAVINYRVNKFGFAYTGNAAAPGNAGLWDQKMAIEFVVNNIANFGGDPNKITVFGESAGASSTSLQMLSPQSKDLFQQAILESGSETNIWTINEPASQPETYIRQVAAQLDCNVTGDFEMIDCLREVPMDALIYDTFVSCARGYFCLGMAPVVDGLGGFLPQTPEELRASGDIMRGPIMAGVLEDDGATFLPGLIPETLFGCCNRTTFKRFLRERILVFWLPRLDDVMAENVIEALDWYFLQWPDINDNAKNREGLIRAVTDGIFGAEWDKQLKAQSQIADTYGFVFDYKSVLSDRPDWLGVTHGEEMYYVFGFPMMQYNPEIQNSSYLYVEPYNEDDIRYSYYVQQLFVNFANYGNPTFTPVEKPLGGVTEWPKFSVDDDLKLLYLAPEVEVISSYRQQTFAFFTEYLAYLIEGIQNKEAHGPDWSLPGETVAAMMDAIMYSSNFDEVETLGQQMEELYEILE